MRRIRDIMRIAAAILTVTAASVLVGCGGAAFESNDFVMTWLTDEPSPAVLATRMRNPESQVRGFLGAQEAIDKIHEADELLAESQRHRANGDLDLAKQAADEAVKARPEDVNCRREAAAVAIRWGDVAEAQLQWQKQDDAAAGNGFDQSRPYYDDLREDILGLQREIVEGQDSGGPKGSVEALAATYERLATIDNEKAVVAEAQGLPGTAAKLRARAEKYRDTARGMK